MNVNYPLIALFTATIFSNIIGPVNLKIMSQLDWKQSMYLFLGLALLHFFIVSSRMITWFKILKKIRLSIAYPVVSITFPVMLIISNRFFAERITALKIMGTILIITGILINHYNND